jgi:galactose-6-phosphate isomerase
MPRLDVSRVLLDPRFCDSTLQCERYAAGVDAQGRGTVTQTLAGFAGVVTSDKGEKLQRTVVGEHAIDTIMVITRFKLRNAGTGATADIVRWNGTRYTVTQVNDYSTYGRGFVECVCEMLPLSG